MTTTTLTFFFRASTAAWTFWSRGTTEKGTNAFGNTSCGASSFVKPTIPTFPPGALNVTDGDHSLGVLPSGPDLSLAAGGA